MRPLSLIALLSVFALPAAAQPWRYINKQGVATYTTNPNDLPPALRKKALAQLEQKRAEAEARRAIEAEAAAAAAPPSIAPGSAAPASAAPASAAPASAAPASAAPPTAREIWQKKVGEASEQVSRLTAELAAAQATADEAHRRAIITPSGQHSAQHAEAQERLAALQKQLADAQGQLQRLEGAAPRK